MKILLLTLFFSVSVSSNVLDDLIIKKTPLTNQAIIELLQSGLTDETDNSNPQLGKGICLAGGVSSYECRNYATSIGKGICRAGGVSSSECRNFVRTINDGIEKIPYKDRTYWWDRFEDQYGNYQWRCRGGQTKQFAENSKCSGVSKDDERWPG
jgi:hypothetical protein